MSKPKVVEGIVSQTAMMNAKDYDAYIVSLAKTPSSGGVLRMLAQAAVGGGIKAAKDENEGWTFRSSWEKTFVPLFYTGDRVRPGLDAIKAGKADQYGDAFVKLGALGTHINWSEADRIRVMGFIMDQKGDSAGGFGVPNMGSLAAELVKDYEKAAPSDTALAKHMAAKRAKRAKRNPASELKAASVVLVNAMGKIATADDYDDVREENPTLHDLAVAAHAAVTAYGNAAASFFKAKADAAKAAADAEKAGRPKKGAKAKKGTPLTAAQRNEMAAQKFAAIAEKSAKGSNGKGQKGSTATH